jgi:aminopeptidase N
MACSAQQYYQEDRNVKRAFLAALLLGTIATPVVAKPAPASTVTTQLPRNARPLHYAISIVPDATKMAFTGTVGIDIELLTASKAVTLNAVDMQFQSVTLTDAMGGSWKPVITFNTEAQTATLTFDKPIAPGAYHLDIAYTGRIYDQANGLFVLDYKDPAGAQKRALFTQFEAPDARRFVPSWDEPNFRTSFNLTAVVPADQMAVGNMPVAERRDLGNGTASVRFQTTPKMSSYLLFFGVGELERITKQVGPTEVGVVMGKGNTAKARYALDASAQLLPYYNDYFGTPYPLPKLDNVAGPGQSQFFSAMENWGAIFTFERVLLNDPKITSERDRQAIFTVAGHEMAHQWFGDLVTMQWWDDLWLNEGFASWMETKATDHFNPDWQVLVDRVDGRETAMALDGYTTTHPVIQRIKTVEQTSQAFDAIAYQKGEAVITMLEGFAGEDTWRAGIRGYMKKHAYGNTSTEDLWAAVEAAGGKGVTRIARDFTRQPGIPLIKVADATCANGKTQLSFVQSEFSRDRKEAAGAKPLRWSVPVLAKATGAPARTIVVGGKGSLTVDGCGTTVVNAGQSGYYRTLYTPAMLSALAKDFGTLKPIDQLGLINDNFALAYGDYQTIGGPLALLGAIPADASPKVLSEAADRIGGFHEMFSKEPTNAANASAYATTHYGPILKRLGFTPRAGEPALDALLRAKLIGQLGTMDDATVTAEAKRLFAALQRDPAALDGPLKSVWLGLIARNADKAGWDQLRGMAQKAENQVTKSTLYSLLGAVRDPALAKAALDLALTTEPGPTISAGIIGRVADENPDMTVDFALANLKRINELVDSSSRSRYIGGLGSTSRDPAMMGKLDAYAKANLGAENRKPVDRAIARIKARLEMEPRVKPGIAAWLAVQR